MIVYSESQIHRRIPQNKPNPIFIYNRIHSYFDF